MKIAISGAGGRMGRLIIALAAEDEDAEIVCALESAESPALGFDAGEQAGVGGIGIPVGTELTGSPDVLVDFSQPLPCIERLRECAKSGIACVVGTTGFDTAGKQEIEKLAEDIPLLVAPNMSLGVNLMFRLAAQVALVLGESYDIEIVEAHHRHKKDAPSGTALKIIENVCSATGRLAEETVSHGRHGITEGRRPGRIGVHAIRGGDIVGEHTVIYAGEGERLEITHRATNRKVFAAGALNACRFILKQKPGLYDMMDMLGSHDWQ